MSGTKTVDLTAIPGTNGGLQDGTNLKVKAIMLRGKSSNLHALELAQGAGIPLFGADYQFSLLPGQQMLWYLGDEGDAVEIGSANKAISLSGDEEESLEFSLVMG